MLSVIVYGYGDTKGGMGAEVEVFCHDVSDVSRVRFTPLASETTQGMLTIHGEEGCIVGLI